VKTVDAGVNLQQLRPYRGLSELVLLFRFLVVCFGVIEHPFCRNVIAIEKDTAVSSIFRERYWYFRGRWRGDLVQTSAIINQQGSEHSTFSLSNDFESDFDMSLCG
jgi:hypothetical protein